MEAKEELGFWIKNISDLNGYAISPEYPSVTTCRVIAGDASGVGLFVAEITSGDRTIATRRFTDFEMHQSSTYRECIVVRDVYSISQGSKGQQFSGSQVMHITDNKGVVAVFTIGSPVKALQAIALDVFRACNHFGIHVQFLWQPRDTPLMQLVDRGSRGPWPIYDDFTVDPKTKKLLVDRGINLDGFASFHNSLCSRFYSLGFQVESAGTDFFLQRLSPSDVVLLHLHPCVLFNALLHASRFKCRCVVLMHIWVGYPPYRNLLRGDICLIFA